MRCASLPSRAFVPVPLIEAEPRIYKSFRSRQLKGILFGAAGAAVGLVALGVRDFAGYASAFLLALPGFAYGYYRPQGKPVEYWLRVLYRFYSTPQRLSAAPRFSRWRVWMAQFDPVLTGLWIAASGRTLPGGDGDLHG
jgi:hypothetical protein